MTRNEEDEFAQLVERQARFVFRVAYAVLLNAEEAEDAAQETFLKLYRNRGWAEPLANERAFLARVTWRVAVDRRRSLATIPRTVVEEGFDVPSTRPDPEHKLLSKDECARVHTMVDALPEDLRLPLVLSAFEELNSREIAAIVGVPEGTVRTRLQRARHMLRDKLAAVQPHREESRHE